MFCQISQNQIESLHEKSKRKNAEMIFTEFQQSDEATVWQSVSAPRLAPTRR